MHCSVHATCELSHVSTRVRADTTNHLLVCQLQCVDSSIPFTHLVLIMLAGHPRGQHRGGAHRVHLPPAH